MVSKSSLAKNNNSALKLDIKKDANSKILDVYFVNKSEKADLMIYFIDEKGLKKIKEEANKNKTKTFINEVATRLSYEKDFETKNGKSANLGKIDGTKVIVIGLGEDKKDNQNKKEKNIVLDIQKAGASIANFVSADDKVLEISNEYANIDDKMLIEAYFGFNQKIYRFSKYLTNEEKVKKLPKVKKVALVGKEKTSINSNEIKKLIDKRQNQLLGIFYVRELGNEPANVLYPETMANEIKNVFAGVKNAKVKVLNKKDIEKLGMNMLLGVAQGSVKEPKVVVVEYLGNPKSKKYDLALIGKGVCFDSGGLSLKPSQYMEGMKGDMIGAATILSSTLSIAKNNVKANIVAVAGLVENMPDGNAQKVGDIVKSMSGKTVEIIDTDAEGRLVLGDILYYTQKTYKPEYMIDMATLTGAIMVALGLERAGIFTNNDDLGNVLKKSGDRTGDKCWVMPMGEEYADAMKSNIADLRNLSSVRYAGSGTAATFLENFIDDNKKWAHIDIAGVDNATKNNAFGIADFVSGFGVKLINDFVENEIESK